MTFAPATIAPMINTNVKRNRQPNLNPNPNLNPFLPGGGGGGVHNRAFPPVSKDDLLSMPMVTYICFIACIKAFAARFGLRVLQDNASIKK